MATAAPELAAVAPMTPRAFAVAGRTRETPDTWTIVLEPLDGTGPAIAPGQFVMAYAFGVGEVPISVSGAPWHPGRVVLTVRAVGAVTRAICAAEVGSVVGLRGPLGNAWPVDEAAGGDVVIVAGGIGLAPLRPVVLRVLERRGDYGSVAVLYGARTPADLLYDAELARWRDELDVEVTVDAPASGWAGHVGVVPHLVETAFLRAEATTAFVCGPEIMMRFAVDALRARGVPPERIMVSLERNMQCGLGLCGHCQLGPVLICRDGPVFVADRAAPWLEAREL